MLSCMCSSNSNIYISTEFPHNDMQDANLQLKALLEENKILVPAKLVVEVVQPEHASHGKVSVDMSEGKQYLFEKVCHQY